MVEIYVKRIKENKMTIEDVPQLWREKVKAKID